MSQSFYRFCRVVLGSNNHPEAKRSNYPATQHGATFVNTDTRPMVPIFSGPPIAPAISLGRRLELEEEGIPSFDSDAFNHPLGLSQPHWQLPLNAIEVSNISTAVISP